MKQLNIKNYAHLGDALWELFVRERTIMMTENLKRLHTLTVGYVNAGFQTKMLEFLAPSLSADELALAKRAGNIRISAKRKVDASLHRTATEFEALLGFLYLHEKPRYDELLQKISESGIFSAPEIR